MINDTRFLWKGMLTAVAVCILAAGACADGCFVWNGGVDLAEPSQKAIIHCHRGTETLVLQVKYEGRAEDFAWIVPLPARPKVTVIEPEKSPFAEISRFTQQRQRYQIEGSRGKGVDAVTVLERKVVGVYDVAVLAATDSKALGRWLARNGFALPGKLTGVLAHYVKKKWVYAAMRIDSKALAGDEVKKLKTGQLQPIRFTFAAARMVYPLRISCVNAGKTEVLLYLLADAPMVLASGPTRPGFSVDRIVPRYHMGGNCDPTYTTPPAVTAKALPLTWQAMRIAKETKRHLVKYRAIYDGSQMTDDLTFKPFQPLPYWKAQLRKAGRNPWQCKRALQFLAMLDRAYKKDIAAADAAIHREIQRRADEERKRRLEDLRRRARDSDPKVRQSVLDWSQTPKDVLLMLADDPDAAIRKRLAARRATFPEVLTKLAADEDAAIRAAVARRRDAPQEVVAKLLKDKEAKVRLVAAWHKLTPSDVQARILARDGGLGTRRYQARYGTNHLLLELLAADADVEVRRRVAQNPKTRRQALEALLGDEDVKVRRSVAGRGGISGQSRARLARDKAPEVRRAAVRWVLDDQTQRHAAKDPAASVRGALAQNPTISAATAALLTADESASIRAVAAKHPKLPLHVLRQLAADTNYLIRLGAARNLSAPADLLRSLAEDRTADVRAAVAVAAATPIDVLLALAADRDGVVRRVVPYSPRTPLTVLRKLARDPDASVNRAAKKALAKRAQQTAETDKSPKRVEPGARSKD